MSKETGGPAFPIQEHIVPKDGVMEVQGTSGITTRDYFAATALPGLMGRDWSHHKGTDVELIKVWAAASYAVADAMLEARK